MIVTKDGTEVAELHPLARRPVSATELIARRRTLPSFDLDALRSDIDELIDPSL